MGEEVKERAKSETPFAMLYEVIHERMGHTKRDAAVLGKIVTALLKESATPQEVNAYIDWYLSDSWRRQNRPLTLAVFRGADTGCISWLAPYRAGLVFNPEKLAKFKGPFIQRRDLKDFDQPLDKAADEYSTLYSLQVSWVREAWLILWYTVAGRQIPVAREMALQSYGVSYADVLVEGDRQRTWQRINQVLGQWRYGTYGWMLQKASPDAGFTLEAFQLMSERKNTVPAVYDNTAF